MSLSPPGLSLCPRTQWPILPILCCVSSREVKTDEGKKLAESWGAIFLESSAKENQVWGRVMYPTWGWERGPQDAGADVPLSSGDPKDLHEDHRGD